MKKILLWVGIGFVVVIAVAFAGWYFFLKSDPAPRAAIKDTPLQTQAPADTSAATEDQATSNTTALDGTYSVKPGSSDNFVGYRVTEKLVANVVESTATGRTNNVTAQHDDQGHDGERRDASKRTSATSRRTRASATAVSTPPASSRTGSRRRSSC